MPSLTTWTRLEPLCRDPDAKTSVEARVQDPLWLLGRQWQLGEFTGEDAGSPVTARVATDAYQITRYLPGGLPGAQGGSGKGERFDPAAIPLETRVEGEPVASGATPSLRFALDAGRHLLRLLAAHATAAQRKKVQAEYALKPADAAVLAALDPESRALHVAAVGRMIDGVAVYRDWSAQPPASGALATVAKAWLAWYNSVYAEPAAKAAAWSDERMEYRFAISAATKKGEVVLEAPEYVEGRLEWYDFRVRPGASLGAVAVESVSESRERVLIPSPIAYPGMPAERWWEFEDARIHFGAVDVQPGDLVTSALLQFAIIYGNDWFVVPVSAKVGSLCDVTSLVVTDSFGVDTSIGSFTRANPKWRMFTQTQPAGQPGEWFFLPPVLAHAVPGPVIEEVLFARDEMANVGWAIERRVESPGGAVLDRRNVAPPATDATALPEAPVLQYQLAAEPPENWVPLIPHLEPGTRTTRLVRGQVRHPAVGRIAGGPERLAIFSEEVPRSGVVVTRSPQWARWIDGSTHLWIGRRKLPGDGEASSGVRFDFLQPPAAP